MLGMNSKVKNPLQFVWAPYLVHEHLQISLITSGGYLLARQRLLDRPLDNSRQVSFLLSRQQLNRKFHFWIETQGKGLGLLRRCWFGHFTPSCPKDG
ncbi:hypothetical protein D9M69_605330 [compost metagenome]